jgi:amino acid adenylation domain-containing protein
MEMIMPIQQQLDQIHSENIHAASYPLTGTQYGIWLADQVSVSKTHYLISQYVELPGSIEIRCLQQAIRQGLSEAETVTASYQASAGSVLQNIRLNVSAEDILVPEIIDLRDQIAGKQQALAWMWGDTQSDISLVSGQALYKQALILVRDESRHEQCLWYQRFHHIMLDGFSITALNRRVAAIYAAFTEGEKPGLSPFSSVSELIQEQASYLSSSEHSADQIFWKHYCETLPASQSLSQRRPQEADSAASLIRFQVDFPVNVCAQLKQMCSLHALEKRQKLNVADLLFALLAAYVCRITGQLRLSIGIPFMRRMGSVAANVLAPAVNVLPVRLDLQADMHILDIARHFKHELIQVRRHQRYDAEKIQRDLRIVGSGHKLYGALINYKMFDYQLDFAELSGRTHHLATGPVDDLEFNLQMQGEQINLELRADGQRYSRQDLEKHAERITNMLTNWLASPHTELIQIDLLGRDERAQLAAWSTGMALPGQIDQNGVSEHILDIFVRQVIATPLAIALIFGDVRLSFNTLSQRVAQLTRLLIKRGVGNNCVVAVIMPRSEQSVIAMLAVLNSGASFLPLDLDFPPERLAMMCEDSNPQFFLSLQNANVTLPAQIARIDLDSDMLRRELVNYATHPVSAEERRLPLCGEHIAYIIFTSGSTGRPKGVMNTHAALLNLFSSHDTTIYRPALKAVAEKYPDRSLRAAHTHSFSFDSSWLQLFWLLHGQQLYIFDEESRRDAHVLVQNVRDLQIDAMDLPPSFLAQMLNSGLMDEQYHRPSLLLIGGEAAPASLWQQLRQFPQLQTHNLYGPTEYTVDTLRANLTDYEHPTIGLPIANTKVYVLDAYLQIVPVGVTGELYVSGSGLALGYLARADLSATRFVANPFSENARNGERMYRTGDLVRWNSEAYLEFVGRGDDQVKVRGYRVEIGDVENAISLLPEVESVVVLADAINNSHRLLAYVVVAAPGVLEKALFSQELMAQLRVQLPEYMLPSVITILDEFPRNVSGKVDRKRLPAAFIQSRQARAENPQQQAVCVAMAKVLRLDTVGVDDDFFVLGGDSISAMMLCTELRRFAYDVKASAVFTQRSVRRIALCLQELVSAVPVSPEAVNKQLITAQQRGSLTLRYGKFSDVAPVLPLQSGMLFHAQTEGETSSYNAFTRLHLRGALDSLRLQNAMNLSLQRYPQLAGLFDLDSAEDPLFLLPEKENNPALIWPWQEHDLTGLTEPCKAQRLAGIEEDLLRQHYVTNNFCGLLNAALIRLSDKHAVLLIVIHHLVIDGWSTPLLLRDILHGYRYPFTKQAALPTEYAHLIRQLHARDFSVSRSLWREVLDQVRPTLLFEQASVRPIQEFSLRLTKEQSQKIMFQLRQQGLTLNALMQAVWAFFFSSLSGRKDVVFGTPVSGRSAAIAGIAEQVGLFLNTIPVRINLLDSLSIWAQLPAIQSRHMQCMENDGLGLAEIQASAGGGQLFDSLLVVENYPENDYLETGLPGSDGQPLYVSDIHNRGYSHYPLALLVLPGDELTLLVENRVADMDAASVAARVAHILTICIQQPELPLSRIPLQYPAEKSLLEQVNATAKELTPHTLRSILKQQSLATPAAIALVDGRHQLSYLELRYQVQSLALKLKHEGVRSGAIVAVALPRSVFLSIAILAIIEAGAAYLPLDTAYPDERILYMLSNAGAKAIITDSASESRFAKFAGTTQLILLDALVAHGADAIILSELPNDLSPEHPAYLIYTSGTTGKPKGVLVSHRAIVNRILWMQNTYQLAAQDVVMQKTPCGFDVSVWEFFWPLMVGARLVMAEPDAHRDPLLLIQAIQHHEVTCLHFVPSMLAMFSMQLNSLSSKKNSLCPSLRLVFCSGEALSKSLALEFSDCSDAALHNLYGPTEAAVDVSYRPAYGDLGEGGLGVPIGLPVWNTQLHVLDAYLRPVPIGVSGELYLCGAQLAIGYLGRTDLTASRFVANPFEKGQRMYRTGDLVRYLQNGEIEYLGRSDDQVKIRGLRIELGEIETIIAQQPGVMSAVVHAVNLQTENVGKKNEDHRQLVAYLVATSAFAYDLEQVKAELQRQLPAHMLPVLYVALSQLPLSANGKLDRKALPVPVLSSVAATVKPAARLPARGLEARLAAVFSQVLQVETVYANDNFFEIGGHSLLAMRLAAEIRRGLKRAVSVGQIMSTPTVEQLAAYLNRDLMLNDFGQDGYDSFIRLREGAGAPLFCFYPGSGFAWQYSVLSRYLKNGQAIIGLQSPRPLGLIAISPDMDSLIQAQLRIIQGLQAHGPYYLLGYSLGGTVAYGVAARLRALGEQVNFLGLLDTYPAEVHDWSDPLGKEANLGAEREQERLLTNALEQEGEAELDTALRDEKEKMLQQIFANYQDAVRLLSNTHTANYDGEVNLFVAQASLPEYIKPEESWKKYVKKLRVHNLPQCSHENILTPLSLISLGPLLERLLEEASSNPASLVG